MEWCIEQVPFVDIILEVMLDGASCACIVLSCVSYLLRQVRALIELAV